MQATKTRYTGSFNISVSIWTLARGLSLSCATTAGVGQRHRVIVEEGGVPIVSNQVSYSLVDTRPGEAMAAYAATKGVKLLCYGTVLGGLLSDKYLGVPEPRGRRQLNTASLGKYKQFVDAWGGWGAFRGGAREGTER